MSFVTPDTSPLHRAASTSFGVPRFCAALRHKKQPTVAGASRTEAQLKTQSEPGHIFFQSNWVQVGLSGLVAGHSSAPVNTAASDVVQQLQP